MSEVVKIQNRETLVLGLVREKKEVTYSVGDKVSYIRLIDGVKESDRIKRIHSRLPLARMESQMVLPLDALLIE